MKLTGIGKWLGAIWLWLQNWEEADVEAHEPFLFAIFQHRSLDALLGSIFA